MRRHRERRGTGLQCETGRSGKASLRGCCLSKTLAYRREPTRRTSRDGCSGHREQPVKVNFWVLHLKNKTELSLPPQRKVLPQMSKGGTRRRRPSFCFGVRPSGQPPLPSNRGQVLIPPHTASQSVHLRAEAGPVFHPPGQKLLLIQKGQSF